MRSKPGQNLEWDQAVITLTRLRMGSGGYNPPEDIFPQTIIELINELINQLVTNLLVDQPRLYRV